MENDIIIKTLRSFLDWYTTNTVTFFENVYTMPELLYRIAFLYLGIIVGRFFYRRFKKHFYKHYKKVVESFNDIQYVMKYKWFDFENNVYSYTEGKYYNFKNMKAFYNLEEATEFAQNNPGDCRCVFSTKHKSYTWDDDGNEKEMLIFAGPYIVSKDWDTAQEFCNNRSLAYLQIYGEISCE